MSFPHWHIKLVLVIVLRLNSIQQGEFWLWKPDCVGVEMEKITAETGEMFYTGEQLNTGGISRSIGVSLKWKSR